MLLKGKLQKKEMSYSADQEGLQKATRRMSGRPMRRINPAVGWVAGVERLHHLLTQRFGRCVSLDYFSIGATHLLYQGNVERNVQPDREIKFFCNSRMGNHKNGLDALQHQGERVAQR